MANLINIEKGLEKYRTKSEWEVRQHLTERQMINESIKIMKKLNEDAMTPSPLSQSERAREEEKMQNYFNNENADVTLKDFLVYENGIVFMNGTINGQIGFSYKYFPAAVIPMLDIPDNQKGQLNLPDVEYLGSFDAQNPENDKLVKMAQAYYQDFEKYWLNNGNEL